MSRLVFANQLRGVAAISVAISHLLGVFWLMRDFVGLATSSPVQPGPTPEVVGWITFTWFQPGPFGVGVFFLISGLVIPISLERHTRLSFLTARLLRIYPTYIAALLIEMAVLAASATYWHKTFPYDTYTILANALLIHNVVDRPTVDMVNWTLAIEIKFYVILALLIGPICRGGLVPLLLLACGLLGFTGGVGSGVLAPYQIAQSLGTEACFLVFMLIGVVFNYHLRGMVSNAGLAMAAGAMALIFVGCWRSSVLASQYPIVTVNYGYALITFATLYVLRRHLPAVPLLDAAAAISFPFYLIHAIVGYSVMEVAMIWGGVGYITALVLAVCIVATLAYVLHMTVERPMIRAGQSLARR